jgi:YbbR domain-containing protein
VTRLLRVVVHNWPLKLAAAGLATLLYGGLVLSQSAQTYNGVVPVQPRGLPDDVVLLSPIAPVTSIRYFAPAGIPVANSTFTAEVDLSGVDATSGSARVSVSVKSVDDRVNILSFEPPTVIVELDALVRLEVPVDVVLGPIPDGVEVGDTVVEPSKATVFGPSSIVSKVDRVRADIVIQPSGLDVDQEVILRPVDSLGDVLSPVEVEPRTAHVTIPVFTDRVSRSLPVSPVVTGTPAAGFEVSSVTVTPLSVTVEGDADELAALVRVDTLPVSVTGASTDFEVPIGLDLPTGIVPLSDAPVRVSIALRPVTSTRNFESGLRLVGAKDFAYALSVDRVLVTVGGSVADLDRLEGSALVMDLDVSDLGPGASEVPVTADLPTGVTLVSASPETVTVTVTVPATPAPSPSP